LAKPIDFECRSLEATPNCVLWDANPSFFENLGFTNVNMLKGAANNGQLINHPLLNFVK